MHRTVADVPTLRRIHLSPRLGSMTQEPRTRTQVTDPTGLVVAANIRRVRERRGLSTYQLAQKLKAEGRPVAPSALAKVERAERRVDVGDLAAIAVALGVSPASLLLPLTAKVGDPVEITGGGTVDALRAWEWGIGRLPLKFAQGEERTELAEFELYGRPQWLKDYVRYSVQAGVSEPARPTAAAQERMASLKERYREETGQELDENALLNLMLGIKPEGGDDGPSVD